MRNRLIYSSLILALAAVLGACNAADTANVNKTAPSPQSQTVYADGAPRVTIDEMLDLVKEGKAVVIDVRNQAAYDMGHIPGSRLIPVQDILNHTDELPRDKMIITYCS